VADGSVYQPERAAPDNVEDVRFWLQTELDKISDAIALVYGEAVSDTNYLVEVAKGNVAGNRMWDALGERETIGTTASGEDMWRGNELTPAPASHVLIPTPPDAGEQMTVESESTADTATGTGAAKVKIEYLDANGYEQTEEVTLTGTTGVDLVETNARFINDMYVSELGSANTTGVATGHIKIYEKTGGASGNVYNMIAAGGNKSMVPHRMVPKDKRLIVQKWLVGEGNNKRLTMRIRSDCNNFVPPVRQAGVFLFKSVIYLNQTTAPMDLAYAIPELCMVKVSVWAAAIDGEASCHWRGILEDYVT